MPARPPPVIADPMGEKLPVVGDRRADDCPPPACPTACGPGEMKCYGGTDPNGCTLPDICTPMKGIGDNNSQKISLKFFL